MDWGPIHPRNPTNGKRTKKWGIRKKFAHYRTCPVIGVSVDDAGHHSLISSGFDLASLSRSRVMTTTEAKPTPWTYFFLRLLFKFVLEVFYGSIVVENEHLIPRNGKPCVLAPNHGNSLSDPILLISTVSPRKRSFLRMTAKDTQFGKGTFSSWLIESVGTLPIKRKKDHAEGEADNSEVMARLIESLGEGDMICLFPEGFSRYHPTIAPLKTGIARIVSDTLSAHKNEPDFEIYLLTCSVTYMHRQQFRSDLLVSFNPPLRLTPKTHPELLGPNVSFDAIRSLTSFMQAQISSGTIDAPSWDIVRAAKLAARMYAPLGTWMGLGDHVRVTRAFVDAFSGRPTTWQSLHEVSWTTKALDGATQSVAETPEDLLRALNSYQDRLTRLGIKDDRIRHPHARRNIYFRMLIRGLTVLFLSVLCLPGLLLWSPIFLTTAYAVHQYKKTGPIWDTFDEIAQYKLLYGLASGTAVWGSATIVASYLAFSPSFANSLPSTLPAWQTVAVIAIFIPVFMWLSLRWFEDDVAAVRALTALWNLRRLSSAEFTSILQIREALHRRVMKLAIDQIRLPTDPEIYFREKGGREKGRVRGPWDSAARYFSLRRRRKRDWNETMRWYDVTEYPAEADVRPKSQ